jgi:hypothetical protein
MPMVYFYHLRIVATLALLFLVGEEKGRTIRWLKLRDNAQGLLLSPEDRCNSRPPVPGQRGEGKDYQMTKIKGTMPKVYFYHLRIVATLVLLFLVGEEKGRTIRWLK